MFKNKKAFFLFFLLFLIVFFFSFKLTLATSGGDAFGIGLIEEDINLGSDDPRSLASRIINIALSILSIIAVALVIYAGFLWMTSGGDEDKIDKAKRTLKNAVIGLIIILVAWGIVWFVFKSLTSDDLFNNSNNNNQGFFQTGLGAMGNCSIESVYPNPGQTAVPRNTNIMATFKEEVASTSVSSSTVIICNEEDFNFSSKECSAPVPFTFNTVDNKIFVFSLGALLGNENGFSNYVVYFSSDILKIDGTTSIFGSCPNNYFSWGFEVSNILDLTPPQINSIFPSPDNFQDQVSVSTSLSFASASLTVLAQPNIYQPASISVSANSNSPVATATINSNYNGDFTNFSVVVADSAGTKAQLSSGSNQLGIFDIINNEVSFTNYFNLTFASNPVSGNSWSVTVIKMTPADTITVGSFVYTFVSAVSSGFNIQISSNINTLATNISNALNNHPNVDAVVESPNPNVVKLKAKVGGSSGNSIALGSSDVSKVSFVSFSGGNNLTENVVVNGVKDKPMNSIIQINFNEAINPVTVSGNSSDVSNSIRIRNLSDNSILSGSFSVSPNYKTIEFKSDEKCGSNACGEDIYCLPANSNLKVELVASELFNCTDVNNCLDKAPFSSCVGSFCTNSNGQRYPLSKLVPISGIMDSASNSFDGNSDGYSFGPASFYNKNVAHNPNTGDSFTWSFWINNKVESDPPVILAVTPQYNATSVDLISPMKIEFDKLMMASSLRTGETVIGEFVHKLINLVSGQLVGYWINSENIDKTPLDGEPDVTNAYIGHGKFFEGASYQAQVGSGVKDIYQNCFKPSAGPGCSATPLTPFCCDGNASVNSCQ